MTHLGMLRRRKVRTIIDIILVMMTIIVMMVIMRMMTILFIICFIVSFDLMSAPGQMHFFPSRLGLGLLEPAKAEFEVLFIIILSHLVNITPSSFTLIH